MPKFKVKYRELVDYEVIVEADDYERAFAEATGVAKPEPCHFEQFPLRVESVSDEPTE